MKTVLKAISLLLVLSMVVVLAACGGKSEPDTTAADTEEVITEAPDAEGTSAIADESLTAAEEETTAAEETTVAEETTEAATEAATEAETETTKAELKAPVNGSVAEIVKFYNECANATKGYDKKMTVKYVQGTMTRLDDISIGLLRGTAEDMLPNDYPHGDTKTYTNGKTADGSNIKDNLPIDGSEKMSTLEPSGVASASCTKSGNGYKVVIKLKSETGNDINFKPKNHASCIDTMNISSKDLEPFTLNNAEVEYTGATITAVINSDGLLDSFDVVEPVVINGELAYKSFNLIKAKVYGEWKQTATFTF
ncbi:MAG: hypothetical protein K6F09_06910 [Clostridiales bacterium]|nr:hypothetical protein [Clostridiales bacterium]